MLPSNKRLCCVLAVLSGRLDSGDGPWGVPSTGALAPCTDGRRSAGVSGLRNGYSCELIAVFCLSSRSPFSVPWPAVLRAVVHSRLTQHGDVYLQRQMLSPRQNVECVQLNTQTPH